MSPSPRVVVSVVMAALAHAGPVGSPVGAQAPAITLYVPLHAAAVAVVGATEQPAVRLLDADGAVRGVPVGTELAANGAWIASFNLGTTLQDRILVSPGDVVEVSVGGETVEVTVPRLSATVDAASDTVTGSAPGFTTASILPHYDPEWHPGRTDPAANIVTVGPDGFLIADYTDRFDFVPGTWGQLLVQDANQNVFVTDFAVGHATAHWDQPLIVLSADPALSPQIVSRDALGGTTFRIWAIPYGGTLYFVPLFNPNDPLDTPQPLSPGDVLSAEDGGRTIFESGVPRITAGLDRARNLALGVAEARSRVRVRLHSQVGAASVLTGTVIANPDGSWRFPIDSTNLGPAAQLDVLSVPATGALAHHTIGRSLGFSTSLFGHRLAGTLLGRGPLTLTHTRPDGKVSSGSASTDALGSFEMELYQPRGEKDRIEPGSLLSASPVWGEIESAAVPQVTAEVSAGLRVIEGDAPPGSVVSARVYTTPVDFFTVEPYERTFIALSDRADQSGRYRLTCPDADCAANYGTVDADDGRLVTRIQWIAAPTSEADVTRAVFRGYATAGEPVALGVEGASLRHALSTPPLGRGFPGWTLDMSDVFTDGLSAGTRIDLDVGGMPVGMNVPPLTWHSHTAEDMVVGDGPPGRLMYVVAVPRPGDATRTAAVAFVVINPDGTWRVDFPDFDFQSGDGLELLIPYPGLLVRWFEDGVAGSDPATPSPTPPAWSAYLPSLRSP